MPSHVYRPLRNPPNWVDRLLVHPMETTFSVVSILGGALIIASLVVMEFTPSKSIDQMPFIIISLVAAFLLSGGILSLVGLNWTGDDISKGWALEKFGWLLAAGGFLTYCITIIWRYPHSIFSWVIPFALALGALLRFWSVTRIEKSTRATIAEVKEKGNE